MKKKIMHKKRNTGFSKKQIKSKKKNRKTRKSKRGGGEKLGFVVYKSPLRENFPIAKPIYLDDEDIGVSQKFEEHLSNNVYDIEDYLYSIKQARNKEKIPKNLLVYVMNIRKPTYIPPIVLES